MREGEFYYIKEVLGLTGVPLPLELKTEFHKFEVRPIFFFYSPFELSPEELHFAKKVLSAVQVSDVQFFNQKDNSKEEILAFTQKHTHSFGISFGISQPLSVHSEWLELPAVSQFLDNSDPKKLEKLKRKAWVDLKKMKSAMEALLNH